jgi:luciferase family oxidoreductase group 1
VHLSILDFNHPGAAVDLMAEADGLGYHRYWIGEHHSKWQCPNPLLLGALLAATSVGIRLGSGGICLGYHSPYRIAEDARLIEFMLPGRFDLGVTRGLPLDPGRLKALLNGRPDDVDYFEKLSELHGLLTGRLAENHPLYKRTLPLESGPPMWVLGGSLNSARWAARSGTGFCISLHHLPDSATAPVLSEEYYRGFVASPEFEEPSLIVVVSMICAVSDRSARLFQNRSLQESSKAPLAKPTIMGSAENCAERLGAVARSCTVDEIMILDLLPAELKQERQSMYQELARQMNLTPRIPA